MGKYSLVKEKKMSHIHLPDGILPVWIWMAGYILSAILLAAARHYGNSATDAGKFVLVGMFSAVMILVMAIPLPLFSFHFNLSVVAGIILGPRLSVIAAFIVNLILSLLGHGGITVAGLNTLVISIEMITGYYAFKALLHRGITLRKSGFLATVTGLAAGSLTSYGIISAGSKWIDRTLLSAAVRAGESEAAVYLNLKRLAVLMFGIGAVGWILEGLLAAAILSSLYRIYPELISREDSSARYGS